MSTLRKALIKLAKENPELRASIVPLLKEADTTKEATFVNRLPAGYNNMLNKVVGLLGDRLTIFGFCVHLLDAAGAADEAVLVDRMLGRYRNENKGMPAVNAADKEPAKKSPKSESQQTHKLAPDTSVRVYDSGDKDLDRYTVVMVGKDWDDSANKGHKMMLGLSEGGRGVSQWAEGKEGPHLGKRIFWEDLSDDTRKHIERRVKDSGE